MTRSICLAGMFVVVAGVWAATLPLHAASWPVTALTTEDGAIVTRTMATREGKCWRGQVYDKELQKCVPAKEKPVKEKKTK
jgi:hypothetical protein